MSILTVCLIMIFFLALAVQKRSDDYCRLGDGGRVYHLRHAVREGLIA